MKIIIVFCSFFFAISSFSQDSITDNHICLKVAPLALLDIYSGSSPRVGIEYKLKKNFALYHEIGTYFPNANGMTNNNGILTKLEFKWYLNRSHLTLNNYISAELFYKYQAYYTYDTIINTPENYRKDYFVSKNVACFTIKYGALTHYKHRILFDKFVGLGIRYKVTRSSLNNQENKNIQPEGDYNTNIIKNMAGIFTYLNFDLGIKIAYSLR